MKNQNLKIFIVEDDPFFGELVRSKVEQSGYEHTTLMKSSANFLDRLLEMPDVVVLDFNIDKMNGIDLLRKIKSVNPNIHVIFLSGQEEMTVAINSLKYGAYDYLEKNESSLSRLMYILQRIQSTNEILEKNAKLSKFRKVVTILAVAVLMSILLYIML